MTLWKQLCLFVGGFLRFCKPMPAAAYENSFICTKKTCFAGGTVPPCCRLWLLEIGLILVSVGNLLEDMFW